jgi:signal peptidase I
MTACLIPFCLKKTTSRDALRYRIIPKISICCDIDKNKLSDLIQFTFIQKGDLSVFGYNTHSDEFWAKKIVKDEFLLHFTLNVKSIGYENSNIIVTPIIGNDKEIKNLILYIKETIELYKSSNFIKYCVDKV